jgi:hypothetical protein
MGYSVQDTRTSAPGTRIGARPLRIPEMTKGSGIDDVFVIEEVDAMFAGVGVLGRSVWAADCVGLCCACM